MSGYIPFTEEQKLRAAAVNLEEYLPLCGETLIPAGREKRLASNHSVTVRGNTWYDHAIEQGGNAVMFLERFYGLPYPQAMCRLLDQSVALYRPEPKEKDRKPFHLPPAHSDMRRVYAYLCKQRGVSAEVVSHFAKEKRLYQSAEPSADSGKTYHNGVFVGVDESGTPRHAHKFGLYTEGKPYRRNVLGSSPEYSFQHIGDSSRLYVFEAPIDLLSFASLYSQNWRQHSYLSLCGVSGKSLLHCLSAHLHFTEVAFCLDNDDAGRQATRRLAEAVHEQRNIRTAVLVPQHKDWNNDLKISRGIEMEPAAQTPAGIPGMQFT